MKLIADVGGTQSQWILIDKEIMQSCKTLGYNPNTHSSRPFFQQIESLFEKEKQNIDAVYYYGAGVGAKSVKIEKNLQSLFTNAHIGVFSDLLGACRGGLQKAAGFVGILGTGAAGCYYDGSYISWQNPSLGYILGDEGSGVALGRRLIKKIYRKEVHPKLIDIFYQQFPLNEQALYRQVYQKNQANTFLASFCPFILQNIHFEDMEKIVKDEFTLFFKTFVSKEMYPKPMPYYFTGSVAYYFKKILIQVAHSLALNISQIDPSPLDGLAVYHQKYE